TASEIIQRLKERLADLPDIEVFMQPVQDLTVDDRVSRNQYQMMLSDPDHALLLEWTPKLVDALAALPEIESVASDLQPMGREAILRIDRDRAARLGVSHSAVSDALYDAFGQRLVSTIFTQSRSCCPTQTMPCFWSGLPNWWTHWLRSQKSRASPATSNPWAGKPFCALIAIAPPAWG